MNKSNSSLSDDLMYYWRKGWPTFVTSLTDDPPAILSIAKECSRIAGVNLDDDEGYRRVSIAVMRIAEFCRDTDPWHKKTLFQINKALQTVLQEMQADRRAKKLAEEQRILSDQFLRDKMKAEENDRLMEEGRLQSQRWYNENWNEELEADFQRWKLSGMKVPNCKINL